MKGVSLLLVAMIALLAFSACGPSESEIRTQQEAQRLAQENQRLREEAARRSQCRISTTKIRNLVRDNWSSIQSEASFLVSNKRDFSIRDTHRDGGELAVDIHSRGFMYPIDFTANFEVEIDDDCNLYGEVVSVYK